VTRSVTEIRDSIETNRAELAVSLEQFRGEVTRLTDWRGQYTRHERQALIGAAATGFVLAGGLAALFRRKRR
jgi:hypothetical protein